MYNFVGVVVYGVNGDKIGIVCDVLVEFEIGCICYFFVDVGGWFSSKEVLVFVGYGCVDDSGVYFDSLIKDQVKDMSEYCVDQVYSSEMMDIDECVLCGNQSQEEYYQCVYQIFDCFQLFEECLVVNKDCFKVGSVQIGKCIEICQEIVLVFLQCEEVVIECYVVIDGCVVEGVVLGEGYQIMSVDFEVECVNISKQVYVIEEVSVGKCVVIEIQQVIEIVGCEVFDVNQIGDVCIIEGIVLIDDIIKCNI